MRKLVWLIRNSIPTQMGLLCFVVATSFLYFSLLGNTLIPFSKLRIEAPLIKRVSLVSTHLRFKFGYIEQEYFFEGIVDGNSYGWTLPSLQDGTKQSLTSIPFNNLIGTRVVIRSDPATSEIYAIEAAGVVLYSYENAKIFRAAVAANRFSLAQWGYLFAFFLFFSAWYFNRNKPSAKTHFSN